MKFNGISWKEGEESDEYIYMYMYLCSFTSVSFFTIALYKAYNQNQTCNTIENAFSADLNKILK